MLDDAALALEEIEPKDKTRTEVLARIVQCAVKSHGSPVGETKQTDPGTIRSARNRLEG